MGTNGGGRKKSSSRRTRRLQDSPGASKKERMKAKRAKRAKRKKKAREWRKKRRQRDAEKKGEKNTVPFTVRQAADIVYSEVGLCKSSSATVLVTAAEADSTACTEPTPRPTDTPTPELTEAPMPKLTEAPTDKPTGDPTNEPIPTSRWRRPPRW